MENEQRIEEFNKIESKIIIELKTWRVGLIVSI